MKKLSLIRIIGFCGLVSLAACKQPVEVQEDACSLDVTEAQYQAYLAEVESRGGDTTDIIPVPRPCLVPTKDPDANLSYNVSLRQFDVEAEAKMQEALRRLKIVVNSYDFKDKVLNHMYNGQRTFVDNAGYSNEEIYEMILAGSETLLPENDSEMDLDITLYYSRKSTVGYTYEDTLRIWVNSKFFWGFTYGQVAANAMHEWTHKIGFDHDFRYNEARDYSVPYAVGTIIEEMIDSM